MYEVTIPLRPVPDNEVGSADNYFKVIRDEYASRYLKMLNIASTPANKADFLRYRMMDDCDMRGIWPDLRTSALADAIRIVPPLRQRMGDLADIDESSKHKWRQWYGQADPIHVRPPDVFQTGTVRLDTDDDDRNAAGMEGGSGNASGSGQEPGKSELAAELEQARIGVADQKFTEVGKGPGFVRAANAMIVAEARERMKEELILLKAKFILPFACERPAKVGSLSGPSRKSELVLWPMVGPLRIDAPEEMWDEVLQPIRITLDDVKKNTSKWVDEHMPLEYLTSRKDIDEKEVRDLLKSADVSRLTGLLAHLLHWVALMPLRFDGPQLSESAMQSLFVAIHENWSQFEKQYRDSKTGVSLVLPCLVLGIKRGIERSFELSYPTLMSHEMLRQQVIDRINTLLMRLFDPDGTYSRFGKFDGEAQAIVLSKKLNAMMASRGATHNKRLHGRMHRATPLVRAVLGLTGTGEHRGTVVDTKTRQMMLQSDLGGTVSSGSVVDPPQDSDRQAALLQAAVDRLPFQNKEFSSGSASARGPMKRKPPQSPRSARGPGPGAAAAALLVGPAAGASARKLGGTVPTAWAGSDPHHSTGSNKDQPVSKANPSSKVPSQALDQTRMPGLPRPPRKGAI